MRQSMTDSQALALQAESAYSLCMSRAFNTAAYAFSSSLLQGLLLSLFLLR
jgi:hypothetical protein